MSAKPKLLFSIPFLVAMITVAISLQGCGSSGGDTIITTSTHTPDNAPTNVSIAVNGIKSINMQWDFVRGADHFAISEDRNGTSNYVDVDGSTDIADLSNSFQVPVHKLHWGTTQFTVDSCNKDKSSRLASTPITLPGALDNAAIGYVKASNTDPLDQFGAALAISADGNTLAVATRHEECATTGINGDQLDNSLYNAGAVYIFKRNGNSWAQEAYIKASSVDSGDSFGFSVSLSADGNTLAVGAPYEDSAATGIGGDQTNSGANASGAVYVFNRSGTTWSQQNYVKASNTQNSDFFGATVATNTDGNTLLVSATNESSSATGVGGNQANNDDAASGAVYLY